MICYLLPEKVQIIANPGGFNSFINCRLLITILSSMLDDVSQVQVDLDNK